MDIEPQPAKLERLKAKLRRDGMDDNMNNYNCLGTQQIMYDRLIRNNRLLRNIANKVVLETDIPVIRYSCICDQTIKVNCLIRHINGGAILIIGSCCYKALTNKESRRQLCSKTNCQNRHSNRNYTVCNDHKKEQIKREKELAKQQQKERVRLEQRRDELANTMFEFGRKYRNCYLKDIHPNYVDWIRKEHIINDRTKLLLEYRDLLKMLF